MAMRKKRKVVPPEGQIRRSQVVTTYGPGAMVDLLSSAVLIGGLDFWSYGTGILPIKEPRLRDALAPRFRAARRELSITEPFREPPTGDDQEPTRKAGITVLEYPDWFVCQNPKCRALVLKSGLELKSKRYWHHCGTGKKPFECVPVRFVGACKRGHLQEWPWISFVHLGGERCAAPSLTLQEGSSGDFSEVRVKCVCGAMRPLSAARGEPKMDCRGHRPWLGREGGEQCEHDLRLMVRTASNSYFAQVVSALTVPEPGRELADVVALHWDKLKAVEELGDLKFVRRQISKALEPFEDEPLFEAITAQRNGTQAAREPLRTAEFKQLSSSPPEQPHVLPPEDSEFFAREAQLSLPAQLERLVVVPKLREVRAQIGFTRLEPATPDLQGEFDLEVQSAPLGLNTDWLPATEILGEGVFIQLSLKELQKWESRQEVKDRKDELQAGYEAWLDTLSKEGREKAPPFLGVRFYLLHSLSHLLISAISLECGYSASAIRERIYCGPSKTDPTPMAAILLSTGSSGTEGTLGGLVEQGRDIVSHLRRAYDLGRLCSNDPVCGHHSPQDDPAERYLEGAACHGCLFIAECSCERFNRYLDRALVVPTLGHPRNLAFFTERP